MSPCRTRYFLVLFLKPWPQAGLCTRPHLLCSKLNVTRYEEELVAGVRFKNQTEVWSQNTYHDCLCLQTKSCKATLGYYNSSESPHQGKGDRAEKGKIMIMKLCRWKMRQEATEWENRGAAQLASAQQTHFLRPQISQCYVSQDSQLVFAVEKQQVLAVLEHDQSGLQCKRTHPLKWTWKAFRL